MFKCDQCRTVVGPGVAEIRRAISRPCVHPTRYQDGALVDKGGKGSQIVQERRLCKLCAQQGDALHPSWISTESELPVVSSDQENGNRITA